MKLDLPVSYVERHLPAYLSILGSQKLATKVAHKLEEAQIDQILDSCRSLVSTTRCSILHPTRRSIHPIRPLRGGLKPIFFGIDSKRGEGVYRNPNFPKPLQSEPIQRKSVVVAKCDITYSALYLP